MSPVHHLNPKIGNNDDSNFTCATCDSSLRGLPKRKNFPNSGEEVGTRRYKYVLMVLIMLSALVKVYPRHMKDDMFVDNKLRGAERVNVRVPEQEISGRTVFMDIVDSFQKQQTNIDGSLEVDTESEVKGDDSQKQDVETDSAPQEEVSIDSSRVPQRQVSPGLALSQIDTVSLHEVQGANVEQPFYQRWGPTSNYKLPDFAVKSLNYNVDEKDSICFVHIGKTAGSTVGCYLGFSHHCDETTELNGVMPMRTTHLFHTDVDNCYDDPAYFLFLVRDPLERAKSAFYYNRPDPDCNDSEWETYERYYTHCPFSTFEAMAQNGLAVDGSASDECKEIAAKAITGEGDTAPIHFYYNYQYYLEAVPEMSRIIVIRSEHLVEDWNNLERQLGGTQDTLTQESIVNHNANTWLGPGDMLLSDESKDIICQALCNEIKVYKKILQLADNLDDFQVQQSFNELEKSCPFEAADEFHCSGPMPDISQKIIENRGSNL